MVGKHISAVACIDEPSLCNSRLYSFDYERAELLISHIHHSSWLHLGN